MWAFGFMPFLFFCGTAIYLRDARPWRDAAIAGGIVTGVWVVAGCELLSLFEAVAFWPLLIWWAVPIIVLGWKHRRWRPKIPELPKDWLVIAIVAATLLALGLIFVQAAATPPNNWDALSYHLPRQVYWMQQRHVGLFPAADIRMLVMQPFAEYGGLHSMILSHGDHWVNLVQWFALALTALTASGIARELRCNARLQAVAALMVVSIPTAALEAANPKNDIVLAFFLCAFAFEGLKAYNARTFSAPLIGAACGLMLLSKGTAMIFGLPVAVWIGASAVRTLGIKRAVRWGTAVMLIVLTINAGFFVRLTAAFGSPLGPRANKGGPPVANTLFTAPALASNLIRNTAMHLASGSARLDAATTRAVAGFHRLLGLDVDDPRTTFPKSAPFAVALELSNEDRAKAPVHVLLGIMAFAIAVAGLFRPGDRWITAFFMVPFVSFALFSYVIAWQEWHPRLHIPVLCLAAPVIVRLLPRIVLPATMLAFGLALVCIVTNQAKPLSHLKYARYRYKDEATLRGIEEAKRAVRERHAPAVGILARRNRCEYFLMSALLRARKPPPLLVNLNNRFPQIKSLHTNADLVIVWDRPAAISNETFFSTYTLISQTGSVAIFEHK
ncbi:MAG TPA: hypothetical protein VJ063_01070 [Verrucomicrobiae bacterium]|nr:hypothetical protein [Verrucomicrobiae bacterium]